MTDPERLLDEAQALSEPARRALEAARDVRPPSDFAGGAWNALATKLPVAGGAGAATVFGAGTVKSIVIGAVIGIAVVGGRAVWPSPPSSTAPSPHADSTSLEARGVSPSTAEVSPRPEGAEPAGTPSLPTEPSTISRSASSRVEPSLRPSPSEGSKDPQGSRAPERAAIVESPLRAETGRSSTAASAANPVAAADAREESRLVATAREALRSGASAKALALLEQARQRFPSGTLLQEREALTIEALAGAGQHAAAVELARAFARDYPGSPYTTRVQSVLAAP